jgi:large subunit ribosomal protein L6
MSRIAKKTLQLPPGVTLSIEGVEAIVTGAKGILKLALHPFVEIKKGDDGYEVSPKAMNKASWVQAGTVRALLQNLIIGVSQGFERRLDLVGVGYRAQCKADVISLTIGYSHPVDFVLPKGVTAITPTQTEIVLSGNDNQMLGQVASEIRSLRRPEPYKGKGIQYKGENIHRKEAKKK